MQEDVKEQAAETVPGLCFLGSALDHLRPKAKRSRTQPPIMTDIAASVLREIVEIVTHHAEQSEQQIKSSLRGLRNRLRKMADANGIPQRSVKRAVKALKSDSLPRALERLGNLARDYGVVISGWMSLTPYRIKQARPAERQPADAESGGGAPGASSDAIWVKVPEKDKFSLIGALGPDAPELLTQAAYRREVTPLAHLLCSVHCELSDTNKKGAVYSIEPVIGENEERKSTKDGPSSIGMITVASGTVHLLTRRINRSVLGADGGDAPSKAEDKVYRSCGFRRGEMSEMWLVFSDAPTHDLAEHLEGVISAARSGSAIPGPLSARSFLVMQWEPNHDRFDLVAPMPIYGKLAEHIQTTWRVAKGDAQRRLEPEDIKLFDDDGFAVRLETLRKHGKILPEFRELARVVQSGSLDEFSAYRGAYREKFHQTFADIPGFDDLLDEKAFSRVKPYVRLLLELCCGIRHTSPEKRRFGALRSESLKHAYGAAAIAKRVYIRRVGSKNEPYGLLVCFGTVGVLKNKMRFSDSPAFRRGSPERNYVDSVVEQYDGHDASAPALPKRRWGWAELRELIRAWDGKSKALKLVDQDKKTEQIVKVSDDELEKWAQDFNPGDHCLDPKRWEYLSKREAYDEVARQVNEAASAPSATDLQRQVQKRMVAAIKGPAEWESYLRKELLRLCLINTWKGRGRDVLTQAVFGWTRQNWQRVYGAVLVQALKLISIDNPNSISFRA